jgi:hypothetical protein
MRHSALFMKALEVVKALRQMPCQDGNLMVLMSTADDMVSAEPLSSISVLAVRVATAATQQGLVMAAPAGSFTFPQLQSVQSQLQSVQSQIQQQPYGQQRVSQRPPGPPRLCWRCGTSGHMAGTCTATLTIPIPSSPRGLELLWGPSLVTRLAVQFLNGRAELGPLGVGSDNAGLKGDCGADVGSCLSLRLN